MVTLTENALSKVKEFFAQEPEAKGKDLRVAVEPSGCAGYQYAFRFDEKRDGDQQVPYEGFNVILDPESAQFLAGSTIDYSDNPAQSGFSISNPNVKKSCGCGNSHQF